MRFRLLDELQSLLNGSPADRVAASDESEPADPDGALESEVIIDSFPSVAPTDSEMPSHAESSAKQEPSARLVVTSTSNAESIIHDIEITVPLDDHSGFTLRNLVNLIYSRQAFIAEALGFNDNIVQEPFIAAIHDPTVDSNEKLMFKIAEVENLCPGIAFDFDERTFTFKFFQGEQTAERVQAYTHFVDLLNQTAKTLKYAFTKSIETDNDQNHI